MIALHLPIATDEELLALRAAINAELRERNYAQYAEYYKQYYITNREHHNKRCARKRQENRMAYAEAQHVIRKCRKAVGMTQAQVAEILGRHHSLISNYETGSTPCDVENVLAAIAAANNMSVAALKELGGVT